MKPTLPSIQSPSNTFLLSVPYRFRIISVSFSYRSPIILLSFSYHSPINLLSRSGNDTEMIRDEAEDVRMRFGESRMANQPCLPADRLYARWVFQPQSVHRPKQRTHSLLMNGSSQLLSAILPASDLSSKSEMDFSNWKNFFSQLEKKLRRL